MWSMFKSWLLVALLIFTNLLGENVADYILKYWLVIYFTVTAWARSVSDSNPSRMMLCMLPGCHVQRYSYLSQLLGHNYQVTDTGDTASDQWTIQCCLWPGKLTVPVYQASICQQNLLSLVVTLEITLVSRWPVATPGETKQLIKIFSNLIYCQLQVSHLYRDGDIVISDVRVCRRLSLFHVGHTCYVHIWSMTSRRAVQW